MTIAHHIAGNYVYGYAWILWPIIHALYVGFFCNRKTGLLLNYLNIVLMLALGFACFLK